MFSFFEKTKPIPSIIEVIGVSTSGKLYFKICGKQTSGYYPRDIEVDLLYSTFTFHNTNAQKILNYLSDKFPITEEVIWPDKK